MFPTPQARTMVLISAQTSPDTPVETARIMSIRTPDDPELRAILREAAMVPTEIIYPIQGEMLPRLNVLLSGLPSTMDVDVRVRGIRRVIETVLFPAGDDSEDHF